MNYLLLPNKKELNIFKAYGFNSFILPLDNYSISYDEYFSIDEINKYGEIYDIYIMINKFFHSENIEKIKKELKKIDVKNIKGIFIEDLSLINVFPKEKIIIYQNHMINNYEAINYYNNLGFKNIVITNELMFNEIEEIRNNTSSNLYYFLISKNILMYSRRTLISNYLEHYNLKGDKKYLLKEKVSKKELIIKEEEGNTTISNNDLFVGNKYLEKLEKIDYLIINLTNVNDEEEKIILNNYNKKEIIDLIKCNYYFLENPSPYKVGDIK